MLQPLITQTHFKKLFWAIGLSASCAFLLSCKSGYNRLYEDSDPDENAPVCSGNPSNGSLSDSGVKVYDLISDLSCEKIEDYVLSGQSVGFGNEAGDDDEYRNYETLVEQLASDTDKTVAVISIDYEKTELFTSGELDEANEVLIKHHDKGGLVSISWTPQNPWVDTQSDKLSPIDDSDLAILYGDDADDEAYIAFNDRLTLVIEKLKALEDKNIPVLFSPFPEMNTTTYWYGAHDDNTEVKFKALWKHVYTAVNAKVDNVLWVYAPRSGTTSQRVSALWGYPANLDIISGISYSDEVNISDYDKYRDQDKPMGMTRLAPATSDGTFDNNKYVTELTDRYPYIAYWIAEHDTDNSDDAGTDNIQRSIYRNTKANELMNASDVASAETIVEEQWLKE